MARTIKLTAKRQATFPRELCDNMRLKPGDSVLVEEAIVEGERVWVLRPAADAHKTWFGALRRYAKGKRHAMEAVRKSIREARRRGRI